MAESSTATPGGAAPAKDEVELLEILRLLIKSKKARTTSDLLKYANQYGAPEAEERLRLLDAENIPLDPEHAITFRRYLAFGLPFSFLMLIFYATYFTIFR